MFANIFYLSNVRVQRITAILYPGHFQSVYLVLYTSDNTIQRQGT